ncbi:ribonuclease domain-containing protein [Actinospica sp.]|uniref:ribonuclease domain-containing protein n=1 Tax=Actinospica sp. TaxID=1872142 RepID=UPI002C08A2AF|nr:ribonuclease domain-containing protein [Actinospica sp.]HWG22980.1 ribonuclease domain-containing protein [Actinospica sp.]
MSTHIMKRLALPKRTVAVLAAVVTAGLGVTLSAGPAQAEVYSSCTVSGCADAASAVQTWDSLGDPTSRGWVNLSDGECSYAGGEYYNDDGQLPNGDTYYEYDVYERACGAHRDAYRIVHDTDTGVWYYSPDHYSDFYQMS